MKTWHIKYKNRQGLHKGVILSIPIVLLCLGISMYPAMSIAASDCPSSMKPTLYIHFNHGDTFDSISELKYERRGGRIVEGGIYGKALLLERNEYLAIDAKEVINPSEGTIIFWVRPHWADDDKTSHTFVSFPWADNHKDYFVISKGWWEKGGGQPYTYFIFNNADRAKTEKVVNYTKGKWTHIACTWRTGEEGCVRLYINGLLAGEGHKKPLQAFYPAGKLYIGADLGTPLSKERWGDGDFDELAVFKRVLSDGDILHIFNSQNPQKSLPLRNAKGQILQTRAIFDEGRGWMTKTGADETIRRIKKAGFNVYIPCVWHGQGTRYPSALAPPEVNATFSEGDPLKYLIEIAHKNGIEVHPWFTVTLRTRNFYPEFYDSGTPEKAFDVHKPAFRRFITNLIVDVVKRYDMDGINLDYIRTMGMCTSDYCKSDYFQRFSRDLLTDIANLSSDGTLEPHLQQWISEDVTKIVRDVRYRVKAIKPNIILSTDGKPQVSPSKEGRDDLVWANSNLTDVCFSMDYRAVPDFEYVNHIASKFNNPKKLIVLVGNFVKGTRPTLPLDATRLVRNISTVQQRWPHGVGVYWYPSLNEDQIQAISQGPFSQLARPMYYMHNP